MISILVTKEDFLKAIEAVIPAYTHSEVDYNYYYTCTCTCTCTSNTDVPGKSCTGEHTLGSYYGSFVCSKDTFLKSLKYLAQLLSPKWRHFHNCYYYYYYSILVIHFLTILTTCVSSSWYWSWQSHHITIRYCPINTIQFI